MSGLNITKDLQDHIDLVKNLSNNINVEVNLIPISWKEQLKNFDCLLFKISDDKTYIDLVIPKSICKSPVSTYFIENKDNISYFITSLLKNKSETNCYVTRDNDFVESFYFLNPTTNNIDEVDNVFQLKEITPPQQQLLNTINQLEFIADSQLYEIPKDSDYMLLKCSLMDKNYTISATYRSFIAKTMIDDVTLYHSMIIKILQTYYNNTVTDRETIQHWPPNTLPSAKTLI
jgi:hypothetical protein